MKSFLKSLYRRLPLLSFLIVIRKLGKPSFYKYLSVYGVFKTKLPNAQSIKLFSNHNLYIEKEIFWSGIYSEFEPHSLKVWMNLCKSSKVILDIGANTGVFSVVGAASTEDGRVISFEPVPYNYSVLEKNIALNNTCDITLERAAVSDKLGSSMMHIQSETVNYINSLEKNRFVNQDSTRIEVNLVTIDNYVSENNLATVDLIKIDVEGHEEAVLNGARKTIEKFHPIVILEILNDQMGAKIERFFKSFGGYGFYLIDDSNATLKERDEVRSEIRTNFIFTTTKILE